MREIRNALLVGTEQRLIEDVEAVGCTFVGAIRRQVTPGDWNIVRNCRAVRCSKKNLGLSGIAFERCELDGFHTVGGKLSTFFYACVFNQVVLKGRLPGFSIRPYYLTPGTSIDIPERSMKLRYEPHVQRQWTEAMHRYYAGVEWALDIRAALFRSFVNFGAVPGHLIIRDPCKHILIRRDSLQNHRWESLMRGVTLQAIRENLRHSPFDSFVLAASSEMSRAEKELGEFERLRELGIAELESG